MHVANSSVVCKCVTTSVYDSAIWLPCMTILYQKDPAQLAYFITCHHLFSTSMQVWDCHTGDVEHAKEAIPADRRPGGRSSDSRLCWRCKAAW